MNISMVLIFVVLIVANIFDTIKEIFWKDGMMFLYGIAITGIFAWLIINQNLKVQKNQHDFEVRKKDYEDILLKLEEIVTWMKKRWFIIDKAKDIERKDFHTISATKNKIFEDEILAMIHNNLKIKSTEFIQMYFYEWHKLYVQINKTFESVYYNKDENTKEEHQNKIRKLKCNLLILKELINIKIKLEQKKFKDNCYSKQMYFNEIKKILNKDSIISHIKWISPPISWIIYSSSWTDDRLDHLLSEIGISESEIKEYKEELEKNYNNNYNNLL